MDARVKPGHDGAALLKVGMTTTFAPPSRPKMLRQLEALGLVVGAEALAIERLGPLQHLLVDRAADGLAVLEDERPLARAPFEPRPRAAPAGAGITEAGVEEARIVHAELAHQRIERHHLGGIV